MKSKIRIPILLILLLSGSRARLGEEPFVRRPHEVLYRTDDRGFPILSEAGFVQLRPEGPGFFAATMLPEVRKHAIAQSSLGKDDWGDPASFATVGRLVRSWYEKHPNGPRIGIHEISSPYAGVGDFDRDGRADHLTHQNGFNFNILMPSDGMPEVFIDLGSRNDQRFSPALMRELIEGLIALGVPTFTTNRRTRLFEVFEGIPPLTGEWKRSPSKDGSEFWRRHDGVSVLIRDALHDHADHVNAQVSPRP